MRKGALLILLLVFIAGCTQEEASIVLTPEESTTEEASAALPLNINVFLDGFKSIFKRNPVLKEDQATFTYDLYSDLRVDIYHIKDEEDYVLNYRDLFSFIQQQTQRETESLFLTEEFPSYILKWVVHEEGATEHRVIDSEIVVAYLNKNDLADHNYIKRVFSYCAPNIVVGITTEKGAGGFDRYLNLENLWANIFVRGEQFTEGIRRDATTRMDVYENFALLREREVCQQMPKGFNDEFERLRREGTREKE